MKNAKALFTFVGMIFAGRTAIHRIRDARTEEDRLELLDAAIPRRASLWIGNRTRVCAHFDESPAELVRRLRIDEARRLLEETPLPLKDVTARTGLGDASTMWRVFTQRLGVTPAAYRQRFAAEPFPAATTLS